LPVGRHALLLVGRRLLSLLLARLLLLRGLVRVELLALAEALALRSGESLVRVLRLDLSLRREVALVPALVSAVPAALSAVALVALAIVRLVASTRAVALAAHVALVVAATATEAASRAARGRLVSGSVDADGAAVEFDVVHRLDGVFGLGVLREAHEAKAAAAASVAVLDHDGLFHIAKLLKFGSERYIIRVPREAANEDFRHGEERRGDAKEDEEAPKVDKRRARVKIK